jgi:uncharacterized protein YndB with AHSA1/START domain
MTGDPVLPHVLERSVTLRAPRATVFRHFTESSCWAAWWGAGSEIAPSVGGRAYVRHPNGVEAEGEVLELEPPARFVFTYGYRSGSPMPVGASRVAVTLADDPAGTRLALRHGFSDREVRDHHVQGWRYQLALLANAVADAQHAPAQAQVEAWCAAWNEPDDARRAGILAALVAPGVRFRDRFSLVEGAADLAAHLAAVHRFMPGLRLEPAGEVRHCQGMLLADWLVRGSDGTERGRGTNVFTLAPDGRLAEVVGFWAAAPPG